MNRQLSKIEIFLYSILGLSSALAINGFFIVVVQDIYSLPDVVTIWLTLKFFMVACITFIVIVLIDGYKRERNKAND